MPDPSTTRLALYKSKSDGSEDVNYTLDLGQNWDKVDTAVGYQAVTSSTRPSAPYSGKPIMQTDTAYSTYVSNGTSPASGSWVEIPNSSAVYGGRFISLFSGSTSAASLMRLAQTGPASGSRAFATRGATDTADHFFFDFDGRMQWSGGGASAGDTNLYRSAANVLKTDDAFQAQSVSGINVPATVVKAATTSRGSTTTLTDDPDLTAALGTGTFLFDIFLSTSGAAIGTGDIQAMVNYTGTITRGTWQGVGTHSTGSTLERNAGNDVGGAAAVFGVNGANFTGLWITGSIVTGGSGTLSLRWAQGTSNATTTNVRQSSYIRTTQIA